MGTSRISFSQLEEKTMLGLRISLNSAAAKVKNTLGETAHTDARLGFGLGAELLHQLSNRIIVTAGAGFNSRGYHDVRAMYFDVPLTVNFRLNGSKGTGVAGFNSQKGFLLGGGIYGGFALGGKYKTTLDGWKKISFGESTADNRSRTDFGYVINAGIMGIGGGIFTLQAFIGAKNVIPKDRQSNGSYIHLNTFNINWILPSAVKSGKKKK